MNTQTEKSTPKSAAHKIVDVLKIKKVHTHAQGVELEFDPPFGKVTFTKAELENKPEPKEGMFVVRYDDGSTNFVPADYFDRGSSGVSAAAAAFAPDYKLHIAEVVLDHKHDRQPFLSKCSCGTQGRFSHEDAAFQWINWHLEAQDEPPLTQRGPLVLSIGSEEAALAQAAPEQSKNKPEDEHPSGQKAKTGGHSWEHHGEQRN